MKFTLIAMLLNLGLGQMVFANAPAVPQTVDSKYGIDSVKCVENLSLYRESFKQWKQSNYQSQAVDHAYQNWNWVFANCPKSSENIYLDGVKMLDYYINQTKDSKRKQILIDSMMLVYDTRLALFPLHYQTGQPQRGAILGRKGVDLYQLDPSRYKEVYAILNESFQTEKSNTASPVYVYYFRCATKMAQKGELDTTAVVDLYDQINEYLDMKIQEYRIAGNEKELANYENIQGNIESTFEPFATCRDLVKIYQQKFDANPNDIDLLKKITKILDKRKCLEEPLYFETSVNLYKLEPSPESAYLIGKLLLKQNRFSEAIPYMEDATNMQDKTKVNDAYIFLAQAYKALGNYPKARQIALKAAETNPERGEVYEFIGDLYVISANDCGDNDLTKKVAYWAAVDKYNQAKRVKPSMAEEIDKKIRLYSAYFPPTEVLFFYNLTEGESYTVGCWINENTTVRAAK